MKKKAYAVFIAAFLAVCLVPFVCMLFAKSEEAIGNESQVEMPSFTKKEGEFNTGILSDLGNYFEHHYAFRPQMITADAKIQASVFLTSNTDAVVTGTDGWLYYASTLDDYMGRNTLSERGMWNLANNIRLVQEYVEGFGSDFLFMVPPNKNSLYPDNMPYYYQIPLNADHNRDTLKAALEDAGVHYLDLFGFFGSQDEILYLKQDSHWNSKGALMVYNEALNRLGKEHEDYSSVNVKKAKSHHGDLCAMIYPASDEAEWDYTYEYEADYEYVINENSLSDTVSVEDYRIEAVNGKADGSLLMYRDSFGNTLIPFFANAYGNSCFSKTVPYNLAMDMEKLHPDTVIIEKVERNLRDFAEEPALIPAPVARVQKADLSPVENAEIEVSQNMANMTFVRFSGELPDGAASEDARFYLGVSGPEGNEILYEMFTVNGEASDFGFLAYLPIAGFGSAEGAEAAELHLYTDR